MMTKQKDLEKFKKEILRSKSAELVSRVAVFKNSSLVIDISFKNFSLGVDLYLDGGGKFEIFPRNDLAKFYLNEIFNFDFIRQKRLKLYENGMPVQLFENFQFNEFKLEENYNLLSFFNNFCLFFEEGILSYIRVNNGFYYSHLINDNLTAIQKNLKYKSDSAVLQNISDFFRGRILSMEETVNRLNSTNCSLARFGDGELTLASSNSGKIVFQDNSYVLAAKLRKLLSIPVEGLLIGIPPLLLENNFWKQFWCTYWPIIGYNFNLYEYANSMVTRPEFFKENGIYGEGLWMRLWNERDICLIYGLNGRFNPNHKIFSNAKSITCITSSPTNAFDDLGRIVSLINESPKKDIYLIALGPAGTLLVSQLHEEGYRCIDIGHLNCSYDNVMLSCDIPESLSYK